jgi:hypothetical protein
MSGRKNCNPHRFQPSMGTIRTTRALSIRTVCRKFTFLRASATGISSDTRDRRRKGLRIASSAPPALSSSKVQNSTNSRPCSSTPRTNTGMARESRTQRRRSAAGWLAAVGPRPRRIGNHSRTEDVCQAELPRMTSSVGFCVIQKTERPILYGLPSSALRSRNQFFATAYHASCCVLWDASVLREVNNSRSSSLSWNSNGQARSLKTWVVHGSWCFVDTHARLFAA